MHLRSVRNNTPGFPVAQHFCSAGQVSQMSGCRLFVCVEEPIILRKQLEMKLIFPLGTVQPDSALVIPQYCIVHPYCARFSRH